MNFKNRGAKSAARQQNSHGIAVVAVLDACLKGGLANNPLMAWEICCLKVLSNHIHCPTDW
ncbi:MAG: hypothetical protein H6R05_251 [Burkholderiaceae bacterium]|nr:hypothetical protein [Burkholderiaceae bacterium]